MNNVSRIFRSCWLLGFVFLGLTVTEPVNAFLTSETDSSSVEWIQVYFNMPVDTSYSKDGIIPNHSWDLVSTLTNMIDHAKYSIDLAVYDLEHHAVGEALARAAKRGLRVRVVTDLYNRFDNREFDEPMWDMLKEAGIITIDDSGTVFWPDGHIEENRLPNAGAHMHHKFAVIDRVSEDPDDHYVWTGSMNLTYTGPYNTNLTIVLKDNEIAKAYEEEFEFMWGSSGSKPDPRNARFHKDKPNVSQNLFWVGDTKVELYFSPMNRSQTKPSISARVEELINTEVDYDMAFIAFAITPTIPISQALWSVSANPDILLNGVIDPSFYGRYRNQGDIWASPEASMLGRSILPAREIRKLHHKTLILDALNPDENDQAIVITGSYNFSKAAESINDENIHIIYSDSIANMFIQDFKGIKGRARGELEAPAPPVHPSQWLPVAGVQDGQVFEVEISPGMRYPVSLLGVDTPRIFAGRDSSYYFADEAKSFLENLLDGKQVRLQGHDGGKPTARYNRYHSYVTAKDDSGKTISVNLEMLKHGMGGYSKYYRQHPDSVSAYMMHIYRAQVDSVGMWAEPEMVGKRVPRYQEDEVEHDFPIFINSATEKELTSLPFIGPARAASIVQYRTQNGPFSDISDLQNIHGIGPRIVDRIRPYVVID